MPPLLSGKTISSSLPRRNHNQIRCGCSIEIGCISISGLYSEKTGKTYDAVVVLDDTGDKYVNFKLEFPAAKGRRKWVPASRELTRSERAAIRRLVNKCANYDSTDKICLPLDCPCYMLNKSKAQPIIMAHGREIKTALPPGVAIATIDAALAEKPKDFEEFCKSWRWLVLKSTGTKASAAPHFNRTPLYPVRYLERRLYRAGHSERIAEPGRSHLAVPLIRNPHKRSVCWWILKALRAGKGPGYERWAKVFNIKQLFQAVLYLKEHGDMNYTEREKKNPIAPPPISMWSVRIKELESKMNANAEL